MRIIDPPATAGGTDSDPSTILTFEAKRFGSVKAAVWTDWLNLVITVRKQTHMAKIAARSLLPSDHFKGSSKAPVMLLEYGDFECSRCVEAFHTLKHALRWLDNSVCFIFRHFPVDGHARAFSAAQAAEAAGSQGKFWEMHDFLFSHSPNLDGPQLIGYAEQLGMRLDLFKREMLEHTHAGKVNDDCTAAAEHGVNETPAFFINGVRYRGDWDLDSLLEAIEDAGVSVLNGATNR